MGSIAPAAQRLILNRNFRAARLIGIVPAAGQIRAVQPDLSHLEVAIFAITPERLCITAPVVTL